MATEDSYVQVAADSTGKKIDNSTLVREIPFDASTPTTIYRQRVVLGSDENPRQQVAVSGEAGRVSLLTDSNNQDALTVLLEIRDLLRMVIGS